MMKKRRRFVCWPPWYRRDLLALFDLLAGEVPWFGYEAGVRHWYCWDTVHPTCLISVDEECNDRLLFCFERLISTTSEGDTPHDLASSLSRSLQTTLLLRICLVYVMIPRVRSGPSSDSFYSSNLNCKGDVSSTDAEQQGPNYPSCWSNAHSREDPTCVAATVHGIVGLGNCEILRASSNS